MFDITFTRTKCFLVSSMTEIWWYWKSLVIRTRMWLCHISLEQIWWFRSHPLLFSNSPVMTNIIYRTTVHIHFSFPSIAKFKTNAYSIPRMYICILTADKTNLSSFLFEFWTIWTAECGLPTIRNRTTVHIYCNNNDTKIIYIQCTYR